MSGSNGYEEADKAAHIGNVVRAEVNRNADYDLEEWIQAQLLLREGEQVLDVGCGNGKQVSAFSKLVGADGRVTGVDIFGKVDGLLDAAQERIGHLKNIELLDHDASLAFDLPDGAFDAVTSCYSIYYVQDVKATLTEFRRMVKSGGRVFVVGPSWDNSREFYDLHRSFSELELSGDFLKRLMSMNDEVVPAALELFDSVKLSPFVNRVYFRGAEGAESIESYYRSSLLYEEVEREGGDGGEVAKKIRGVAERAIEEQGYYAMTKRALGVFAQKG